MDVQSVVKAQKTSLFGNFGATAESTSAQNTAGPGSAPNAFSALLNLVGVKFDTGAAIGSMETKLMQSDAAAHTAQADSRDEDDDNAPRPVVKAKSTKDDDKNTKPAKDDDSKTDASTTTSDTSTDQTAADQAQTAVQAAVASTVQLPVAAEVQAAPVVAAVQQAAVTETAAATTDAVAQTAAVTAAAQVQAAAVVAQPAQVAKAADAVAQTTGPVVAQAKTTDTGPQLVQAEATVATTEDTTADTDTAAQTVTAAAVKTAAVKDAGPKETRSAAAVDQSQAMSRDLGDDTKIQVKVQVTGKVAANQTFNDASPYNIYTGYTGAADTTSTANGQVGQANASNALVQQAIKPEVQVQMQAQAAPIILPPQLQSQQAPLPAPAPMASADAGPIQALESSSGAENNAQGASSQNGGFASVAGQAQNAPSTQSTAASQQTATDRPQVSAQQIVDQIKVVINRAAKSGLDQVQIQLKPAELGRIDVKLEMSEDHKVSVTVTADNKDTLALLQSDSHTLEKTLNDAGLRTDSANLHFNLRSESDPREAQNGQAQGQNRGAGQNSGDAAQNDTAPQYDYAVAALNRGGVDTFA